MYKNIKFSQISGLFIALAIILAAHALKTFYQIRNHHIAAEKRVKHIFVIQSFIYQNSKSHKNHDTIITLFNGERQKYEDKRLYCKRKLSTGNSEIVPANIIRLIYGPRQCLLTLYRLSCHFHASKENEKTVNYEIGTTFNSRQKIKFHQFSLSEPDTKPREFVSCMSRMIAFEDWALFLVQMETFRYYGGSLVVAYVECAIKKVYEMMKNYEADGILKIRHSYKASDTPNSPYDPDSQTEYANQMSNSHMCLYEFKESAEFIAFTDWDDVLIGPNFGQKFGTFAEGFRKLSLPNPHAVAFAVSRLPTINAKAFRPKFPQFSMQKLFEQIHYSFETVPPKMVVRPKFVAGVWIHRLIEAESIEYQQINVTSETATLLHLKNLILDFDETEKIFDQLQYPQNGSHIIDGKILESNMQKMFQKFNFAFERPLKFLTFKDIR